MNSSYQPIIILGMHRSGTTMIASMLKSLGLFIGHDLEHNSESIYFIRMNDWLLRQSGSSWDNPEFLKYFYENEDLLQLSERYIRDRLRNLSSSAYLGWRKYLAGERITLGRVSGPWGWKDPRMTYTLPFWLRIYPGAKIINVYRNGVPVAASLRYRERKNIRVAQDAQRGMPRLKDYHYKEREDGFVASCRCLSLEGAFSLWEDYMNTAHNTLANISNETVSVRYEEFLQNPSILLSQLASFCGLRVDDEVINKVASQVKPERGSDYLSDIELAQFYRNVTNRDTMMRYGY